jgi:hypothetical protein
MKEVSENPSHFTDCLIPAGLTALFTRLSIFRRENSSESQEISRLLAAQRSLKNLMEQQEAERMAIKLKILDYKENIAHIYHQIVAEENHLISEEENLTLTQNAAQSQEVILYEEYSTLIQSYPFTQDYSKLSAADIEAFYDCFHEHHHLTMEIAYHLLEVMDNNLRELHQKFMELPPSIVTPTNKK